MMMSSKDTRNYKEINVDEENEADFHEHKKPSRKYFLRQLLVTSTLWTLYFLNGLILGAPTVTIAQLRRQKDFEIDDETASWISSILFFGSLPWTLIIPSSSHFFGRKKTIVLVCLTAFVGYLFFYLSNNVLQLLVGETILGVLLGCLGSIGPVTITEYVSPKYRGILLTTKSASIFWGMWVSNFIGTFWNWKNIAYVAFACNAYTMTVFIWPESPYWLAMNGKYAECSKSHRWLKGTSVEVEDELNHLIQSNKRYREEQNNKNILFTRDYFYTMIKSAKCKSFYKPLFIGILINVQYYLTGKLVCSVYAIEMFKKITENESTAYRGMLILDGITVVSLYCGCVISHFFRRRTYLLCTSCFSICFLLILSLYLLLIQKTMIPENNIVTISLLGFYSVAVSSGPIILVTSVYGEVIPLRYQRPSTIICELTSVTVCILLMKFAMKLFSALTLSGTFLFYALSSSIIIYLLYLYLPETKDKTLMEIECFFMGTATKVEENDDFDK